MVAGDLDFSGVGLKIARAQRHTADLNKAMKVALGPDRYIIDSKREAETGHYVYSVPKLPRLDPEWRVIVGETLFNLRSALDHLAWQLVKLDGGKPWENTQFPIKDTPFNKKGKLIRVNLDPPLRDRNILCALEEAQPYMGMNGAPIIVDHPLQRLRMLNNWDKHRLLLLAVQVLDVNRVYWGGNEGDPQPAWWFERGPLKDGSPIARFDFGNAERPEHFEPNLTLQVAIEEPLTPDGSRTRLAPLSPLLTELEWGVGPLTIATTFHHLLPASAMAQMFPPT